MKSVARLIPTRRRLDVQLVAEGSIRMINGIEVQHFTPLRKCKPMYSNRRDA